MVWIKKYHQQFQSSSSTGNIRGARRGRGLLTCHLATVSVISCAIVTETTSAHVLSQRPSLSGIALIDSKEPLGTLDFKTWYKEGAKSGKIRLDWT